ncbi:hypothetical protein [Kitasatospora sp. CB01950]|uniref:hypothetical protein n=1 Tax=Kitasatospora sp. CB01950 TaxID=1703930 RepID=UPI00095BD6C9|nr:hypothetical protein [Kitasatospora sp. CB01950]OKI99914.1 hypothetical protein AMK19_30825 [Kitasatospora sp. CB01950]
MPSRDIRRSRQPPSPFPTGAPRPLPSPPLIRPLPPPLTTVRQPTDRLALEVGRSVLALVGNRDTSTGELLFDSELVIRATTAPAPLR